MAFEIIVVQTFQCILQKLLIQKVNFQLESCNKLLRKWDERASNYNFTQGMIQKEFLSLVTVCLFDITTIITKGQL